MGELDREVGAIVSGPEGPGPKALRIADAIRRAGAYRWVGIYQVGPEEIAAMGWSGPGPPEHPRFPVTEGLCGAAVAQRATVVVGDVSADARYLTTLGTTRSEIVVPVFAADRQRVVGLIDVESQHKDAFSGADRGLLERCALMMAPLWGPG
jgi:L-methionine (R)-S-oxide reductase